MSCPVLTREPRSTPIHFTNPVTLGKMATSSYGSSSPGRRTVIASFCVTTLATSTLGVGAAACAGDLLSCPQELKTRTAAQRATSTGRLIVHPRLGFRLRNQVLRSGWPDSRVQGAVIGCWLVPGQARKRKEVSVDW